MKTDKKHIPDPLYFIACKKMYEQKALSRAEKDAILVERKRTTAILSANKKPKINISKLAQFLEIERTKSSRNYAKRKKAKLLGDN